MKYKLMIFDCDGVLVDSEPISNPLFTDMVNELGLNFSYKESEKLFTGRADDDCIAIIEAKLGRSVPAGFMGDFNSRLLVLLEEELEPVKNIKRALDALHRLQTTGLRHQECQLQELLVCVASNAPITKTKASLRITGLRSYFGDNIFSVQDVSRGKPFPDLYLFAAETMGVSPAECIVIEDSVFGARAGIAAGMTVYGYTERTDKKLLKAEGAITFDNMLELPGLLLPPDLG